MSQHFADFAARILRSWLFVLFQFLFIGIWISVALFFPKLGLDSSSFDTLKIILLAEASFVGSILLMNQHWQSEKSRHIIYGDYFLDIQIRQELRELRPMVEALHKDLKKKSEDAQSTSN